MTDHLFSTLEKERHDHIVLMHKGSADPHPGVNISNFVSSKTAVTDDFVVSLSSNDRILMDAFVSSHHQQRKIPDDREMCIADVWMTTQERSLFRKFPFVLKIDLTFKTNSRGFPFLRYHLHFLAHHFIFRHFSPKRNVTLLVCAITKVGNIESIVVTIPSVESMHLILVISIQDIYIKYTRLGFKKFQRQVYS
jgi:hypothetical protein